MATLSRLVCLAFLCFFLETSNAEGRIAYKKIWNITGQITYSDFYASKNYDDLTYVNCKRFEHAREYNCTAVQETQSQKSCPFLPHTYYVNVMRVYPFGSTRLVILWIQYLGDPEKSLHMCTVLDLTTCQSKDLVIPYTSIRDNHKLLFVPYDDSFDIVVPRDNKSSYGQYSIDAKGNIISSSILDLKLPFYSDVYHIKYSTFRMMASSTDKMLKLYVKNQDDGQLKSSLVRKPDGTWEKIAPFYKNFSGDGIFGSFDPLNKEDDEYMKNIAGDSTAHGRISIAVATKTHAKVWQFDQEGNLKLNASIEHEFFVSYVRVHNTADGGLFLLSMDTGDEWETINYDKYKKYYLTKVAADGNITGTIQNAADPDINLDRDTNIQVFENDANEYCVNFQNTYAYMGWVKSNEGSRLVMCFKESDFSVNKAAHVI